MNTKAVKKHVAKLLFPDDVRCALCGREYGMGEGFSICRNCRLHLPLTEGKGYAVEVPCYWPMLYRDDGAKLIWLLKFHNARYLARTMGRIAADYACTLKTLPDALVPVPLSAKRMRERGYNQSALIAKEMGAILDIPVLEILERSRETVPQMKLARAQRLKNVKDAFRCTTSVHGMRIWIIDDVLTTGSTIHACAQALRMQGGLVEAFVMAHTE